MQQLIADSVGTAINIIYEFWFQIFVVFCVIFQTDGLRITILDMFPKLLKFQREAIWLEWAIVIPLYGPTVFVLFYTGLIAVDLVEEKITLTPTVPQRGFNLDYLMWLFTRISGLTIILLSLIGMYRRSTWEHAPKWTGPPSCAGPSSQSPTMWLQQQYP